MITRTGMYRVTVSDAKNPANIHSGIHQIIVQRIKPSVGQLVTVYKPLDRSDKTLPDALVQLHGASGPSAPIGNGSWFYQRGAAAALSMLDTLEDEGRVVCTLIEQPELDALADRLHGKKWLELLEKEQIAACKLLESETPGYIESRQAESTAQASWLIMTPRKTD
jgi:hypothetical protein